MTTPAISRDELDRTSYVSEGKRLTPLPIVPLAPRTFEQYYAGRYRVRPQSGISPVRPDGSRAPRAWQHKWFVFKSFPKTLQYTNQYVGTQTFEVKEIGYCGGVGKRPASTFDSLRKEIYSQARFTWCYGSPLAEFPPSAIAQATTRFRNKALEGVADLGATLVEFRETASFLHDMCRGVEKTVRTLASKSPKQLVRDWASMSKNDLARAKRKRVLETLYRGRVSRRLARESKSAYRRRIAAEKSVLNGWLTYQFAVRPLVMDLHAAAASLSYWQFDRQLPMRLTVKAGAQTKWEERCSFALGHGAGGTGCTIQESWEIACLARAHYSGVFEIPPGTDRDFQQLGLTNPAAAIWEGVLFSWLVDYGLGVGEWLQSMTRMDHIKFVEGTLSLIGKVNSTDGKVSYNPGPKCISVKGEGVIFVDGGRFDRQVLTQTPAAAGFPAFKRSIGVTQVANALSALAGLGNPSLRL